MTWHQRWRRYGPDARTFLAATIFILVATLCYGFLQRVQQADALIDTAEQSVQQVTDLRAQVATQQQLMVEQQHAATERASRARAERDRLQAQLALILDYLREQGIDVPPTLTAPAAATSRKTPRTSAPKRTSRPPARRQSTLSTLLSGTPSLLNPSGKTRGESAHHRNPNANQRGPKR